ncbi:MAG TPA: hypothetical protein VK980_04220 [Sphingomonas sp.]|nr:hypothetical protein [Sphingomonas sp.]
MPIDTGAFVIGTILARNQGVKGSGAANRAGLLMGLGGLSATGVLLAESSINSAKRSERAGVQPSTPPPTPTSSGGPTWPVSTPPAGITADDLKAGLDAGFGKIAAQLDAQSKALGSQIEALTAAVTASTAANKKNS